MIETMTQTEMARGVRALSKRDRGLAWIVDHVGPPPLWGRRPGFATLVKVILEQQVSLASARAAYERLVTTVRPVTPRRVLSLSDGQLKRAGFSRQKIGYTRGLAHAIVDGTLELNGLNALLDEDVRDELMKIRGIGRWTADIYLLMALRRRDIWPSGDLALATSFKRLRGLRSAPTPEELDTIGGRWKPWRAVAARILWKYYLSGMEARRSAA